MNFRKIKRALKRLIKQTAEAANISKSEVDRTEYLNIVAIKALAGHDREYVRKYMDENYILIGGQNDTTTLSEGSQ